MIVIRYEGPRGGPGMPEMLTPTSMIMGRGLGGDVALIADGDVIRIDAIGNTIEADIPPAKIEARRKTWTAPPLRATSGALYRYARTVSPASEGCTTDRIQDA